MCSTCGCGGAGLEPQTRADVRPHAHDHAHDGHHDHGDSSHDHVHDHDHPGHAHEDGHGPALPRANGNKVLQIELALLAENDRLAAQNRAFLDGRRTRGFNLISSPGAGKTTLLEKTLASLSAALVPCAVIEGDQKTDLDAQRIARTGVPVFQIETGRSCHLDAGQVQRAMKGLDVPDRGLFFIENVGNLICPTEFALGEHERVTIVSVAEGHDKPAKYPLAFSSATAVVISKIDLLPHVDFDIAEAKRVILGLNPNAPVFELSARTGVGMEAWLSWLRSSPPVRV